MSSAVSLDPPKSPGGAWFRNGALAGSANIAPFPAANQGRNGMVFWVGAHNTAGTVRYLFVFDGTSSAGALIVGPLAVAGNGDVVWNNLYGKPFLTGLFIAFSTTDATFTQDAGSSAWFDVGYHVLARG